jgi:hypothetical protein
MSHDIHVQRHLGYPCRGTQGIHAGTQGIHVDIGILVSAHKAHE